MVIVINIGCLVFTAVTIIVKEQLIMAFQQDMASKSAANHEQVKFNFGLMKDLTRLSKINAVSLNVEPFILGINQREKN